MKERPRDFAGWALALALCVSACADPIVFDEMSCGGLTAPLSDEFPSPGVRDVDVVAALEIWAADTDSQNWANAYDWGLWSKSEVEMDLLGVSEDGFATARFFRDRGTWRWAGGAECHWTPVVGRDWFLAAWWLAEDLAPEATTFAILAMVACASDEALQELDYEVILWENPETVTVFAIVESVAGEPDCVGTSRLPLTVELGSPIGDRTLFDGSIEPPAEVGTRPLDSFNP
jgi:hypothetical protein